MRILKGSKYLFSRIAFLTVLIGLAGFRRKKIAK